MIYEVEEAFISAIREGDVVLHPEKNEWMRVGHVEIRTVTIHTYDQEKGERDRDEPQVFLTLYQLDRDSWETPIPFRLHFKDIEGRISRRKPGE
jgi:hypothetical protein